MKKYLKIFIQWLELDDRTNVPPISEESAQENCKPHPNSVVSIKVQPPTDSV